jgi:plasmid stability protein
MGSEDKKKEFIVRNIPADLHRAFKIRCMQTDVTMNKRVIQLIKADLQGAEQGKKKS